MKRKTWVFLSLVMALCLMISLAAADSLVMDTCGVRTDGLIHLAWTCDLPAESFTVESFYFKNGMDHECQVEQVTVNGNECDLFGIPGTLMSFVVTPEGSEVSQTASVYLPENNFNEFKVTSSVQLKKTRYGKSARLYSFSSFELSTWLDDIISGTSTTEALSFDAQLNFRTPKLGRERVYNVLVTLTAPDGTTSLAMYDRQSEFIELSTQIDWYYDLPLFYSFYELYANTKEIPAGTYTLTMYFDSMKVTSTTLKVDP